jgi:hypothetical protein
MREFIEKLLGKTNQQNIFVDRYRVLIDEFKAIEKMLVTEWQHKVKIVDVEKEIIPKGQKSYSISIETYEDSDYYHLLSDLKACKSFIYATYDFPPSIDFTDYHELSMQNRRFADDYFFVGNLSCNNRFINKLYITFYY